MSADLNRRGFLRLLVGGAAAAAAPTKAYSFLGDILRKKVEPVTSVDFQVAGLNDIERIEELNEFAREMLEMMNAELARQIFYGRPGYRLGAPRLTGLASRYSSVGGNK